MGQSQLHGPSASRKRYLPFDVLLHTRFWHNERDPAVRVVATLDDPSFGLQSTSFEGMN